MEINDSITLDLSGKTQIIPVYAKQGDQNSRTLTVTLVDNGASYTIPSGAVARFAMRKPQSGDNVLDDAAISNNQVEITLTQQMLAESLKYAVMVVASVPVLLLYPFLQRYFVKGVMVGAIKG